jgi:hypothetical protein
VMASRNCRQLFRRRVTPQDGRRRNTRSRTQSRARRTCLGCAAVQSGTRFPRQVVARTLASPARLGSCRRAHVFRTSTAAAAAAGRARDTTDAPRRHSRRRGRRRLFAAGTFRFCPCGRISCLRPSAVSQTGADVSDQPVPFIFGVEDRSTNRPDCTPTYSEGTVPAAE